MTEVIAKSAEQIAAEAAQAAHAKAEKDAAKAHAKAEKDVAKLAAKELVAQQKEATIVANKEKKQAEVEAKAAAKAEAAIAKAELKAESKVKVVQPQFNGVTRPRADGKCGRVWAIADSLSAGIGGPVSISVLQPACNAAGLNDATTRTQYARWKAFNGVVGVVAKPAVAVAVDVPVAAEY